MYKYIITWVVVSMQTMPSSYATIQLELGITNSMSTLGLNFVTVKEKREKVFDNKKEAIIFYNHAKTYSEISEVKIDSIK